MKVTNEDRRMRRHVLLQALRNQPELSVEDAAKAYGLSTLTVCNYASRAGVSLTGRGKGASMNSKNPKRDSEWVSRYRDGETLNDIASTAVPPVSRERVRQVLFSYEKRTGEKLPRHTGAPGVFRSERVEWKCEICSESRWITEAYRDRYASARCSKCRNIDVDKFEKQIDMRRELGNWHRASIAAGYSPTSVSMQRHIYRYLRQMGRRPEINELWPQGVPPWLIRACGA